MIRKRTALILALMVLVVVAICSGMDYVYSKSFGYNPNSYPKNGLLNFYPDHIGYAKIDPGTILVSLDRGELDVFATEIATPTAPVINSTISWHQSDYLEVADAVVQSVWKESPSSWSLLSMVFDVTCRDKPEGFESGDIHVFEMNGQSRYTTREVIITPRYADVSWGTGGEGADFPRPTSGWKSIDRSNLKVTADNALRIAEENGGSSFRLATGNKCRVSMILDLNAYGDWRVDYEWNEAAFTIRIDPFTGKVLSSKSYVPTP